MPSNQGGSVYAEQQQTMKAFVCDVHAAASMLHEARSERRTTQPQEAVTLTKGDSSNNLQYASLLVSMQAIPEAHPGKILLRHCVREHACKVDCCDSLKPGDTNAAHSSEYTMNV